MIKPMMVMVLLAVSLLAGPVNAQHAKQQWGQDMSRPPLLVKTLSTADNRRLFLRAVSEIDSKMVNGNQVDTWAVVNIAFEADKKLALLNPPNDDPTTARNEAVDWYYHPFLKANSLKAGFIPIDELARLATTGKLRFPVRIKKSAKHRIKPMVTCKTCPKGGA